MGKSGSYVAAILFQETANMVIDGGSYEVIKFPSNGTATIYKGSIETLWRNYITTSNKKFNTFFPAGTTVTVEGKAFTSKLYDTSRLLDVEAVRLETDSLSVVYLDLHGTDDSTGSEYSPVRSFAKAKELVEEGGTIYLKPYYRPAGSNETWSLSDKSGVTVKRAPGTTGTMVEVQSQTLTLENISFDGSLDGSFQDLGAIIKADYDAKLVMNTGTKLQNNKGMAVHIDNASFTMNGGTIQNCESSDMAAINVGTNYNLSRKIELKGGTVNGNISGIGGDIEISPSFGVNGSISLSGSSKLIFTGIPVKNYSLLLGKGYIITAGTVIVELADSVSGSLDLSRFTLTDDNFTLMMGNGDTAGKIVRIAVISNTNELKSAINESAGTENVPANIFIKQNGFNVDTKINIPSDKYVKITGGTLTRDNNLKSVPLFNVQGGLTLENITLDGNKENASGDGLVEVDGGKFTLNTGAVLQNNKNLSNGGAVRVCGGGSVTMNDGEITGNEALAGGGVFAFAYFNDAEGGTFTMNGGEISGNTADAGSGVYIAEKGAFNLHSGATISGNAAPESVSQGGWDGDIEIELRPGSNSNTRSIFNTQTPMAASFDVTIPSSPDSWGGGVYNMGAFTMDGGEISNNTAGRGGAVYHADGSCTITGGVINGNHNTFSGTGLYAREDFSVGGGADLKDGIYLVTNKKALVTSGLSNAIQIEGMEGTSASGTVVAAGSSYTISDSDFQKFSIADTAWKLEKNAGGQIILKSAVVALTGTVTISGTLKCNEQLTANVSNTNNTGTLSYQWKRGEANIGTGSTYTTVEADIGHTLTCVVTSSVESGYVSGSTTAVIAKAGGPSAPVITFSFDGVNQNKLVGADTTMQYSLDGGLSWTNCTADTDLTESLGNISETNDIKVRIKESSTHLAGNITTIDITKGDVVKGVTSENCTTTENNDGKLKGVTSAMEYKLSTATAWTVGTGSTITGLVNGTYDVRMKAAGTALAGDSSSFSITKYTQTPTHGGDESSSSGDSSSSSSSISAPSTTTNTSVQENGDTVTTTQTTSTDSSGKKTTVTTEVTKDVAGNVTGSVTTVTTNNITTSSGQQFSVISVKPEASTINSAAGSVGATSVNPMDIAVTVPEETIVNELQKAEVNAVNINIVIPKSVSDNHAVGVIGVTIKKEVVESARQFSKSLEVTVREEAGAVEAVWSLDGQTMRNVMGQATDLNLGVHIAPVQSNDPVAVTVKPPVMEGGHDNGLVLAITASGTLLTSAKLTVPATNQTDFIAGSNVILYQFNPVEGILSRVSENVYTVDINGNITIDIPAGTRTGKTETYALLMAPVQGIPEEIGKGLTHTIRKGDTLNKISRQYGCSVQELLALNPGLDIYDLKVGQLLNIPGKVQ